MHTCKQGMLKGYCGGDARSTSSVAASSSRIQGFSLIEVMIALGVAVFALIALCGLLSSGLRVARLAKTELFAAQVASTILAERRAAPTAEMSTCPLPPLTSTNATSGLKLALLNEAGKEASGSDAYYSLLYEIEPAGDDLTRVFIALSHPPQTGSDYQAISKAEENYETTTYIRLK